jgi:AraC-like DNA-binding protein
MAGFSPRQPASGTVPSVRRTIPLATLNGFSLSEVRISVQASTWSRPECPGRYRLVFVRRGAYRMRAPSLDVVVDPTTAYVTRPDHYHQIAHKPGSEDVCTELLLSESFLVEKVGAEVPATNRMLFTDGSVDLAHRALVARSRRPVDAFELEERVLRLVGDTLGVPWHEEASGSPVGSTTRRRVVERARELLTDAPALPGLTQLAKQAGVSPHYLSRIFRQETGETLSRFRNRIRIRRALERIEAGEDDLAELALELGFADQAHFTRTMRDEVGIPPTSVRREFAV